MTDHFEWIDVGEMIEREREDARILNFKPGSLFASADNRGWVDSWSTIADGRNEGAGLYTNEMSQEVGHGSWEGWIHMKEAETKLRRTLWQRIKGWFGL